MENSITDSTIEQLAAAVEELDNAACDQEQAQYYDKTMSLNDLDIEEDLMRLLWWYRYD